MKVLTLLAVEQFDGKSLFHFEAESDTTQAVFGSPLWVAKVEKLQFPVKCMVDIQERVAGEVYGKEGSKDLVYKTDHYAIEKLVPFGMSTQYVPEPKKRVESPKPFGES